MKNTIIKYSLVVVAVALLVMLFVLTVVNNTVSSTLLSGDFSLSFCNLAETEQQGALGTLITGIATVVFAGATILLGLCCDLKIFKADKFAKLSGVLCVGFAAACLIFAIVLTSAIDTASYGVTDVSIGLGTISAMVGALMCCGAMFVQ